MVSTFAPMTCYYILLRTRNADVQNVVDLDVSPKTSEEYYVPKRMVACGLKELISYKRIQEKKLYSLLKATFYINKF